MAEPITINLRHVARGLNIPLHQVEAVVELLDEGNTVPFITRYRKDQTGGLDEEKIRAIQTNLAKARLLAERKQTILRSIQAQGKLTEALAKRIEAAGTTKRLEDLYLPYKPKKQSLATLARSRGLELLAQEILSGAVGRDELDARARDFANPDRQVPTAADALLGAGHILAEQFSENAELRQRLREVLNRTGHIVSTRCVPEGESAKPSELFQPTKPAKRQSDRGEASQAPAGQGGDEAHSAMATGPRHSPHSDQTSQQSPHSTESSQPPQPTSPDEASAAAGSETPAPPAVVSEGTGGGPPDAVAQGAVLSEQPGLQSPESEAMGTPPGVTGLQRGGTGLVGNDAAMPGPAIPDPPEEGVAPLPAVGDGREPDSENELDSKKESDSKGQEDPAGAGQAVDEGAPGGLAVPAAEITGSDSDAGKGEGALPYSEAGREGTQQESAGQGSGQGVAAVVATGGPAEPPAPASPSPPSAPSPAAAKAVKPKRQLGKAELKRLEKEQRRKKLEERRLKAFADYFEYREAIRRIPPHRILAINRGERARILRVKIECDLDEMYRVVDEVCVPPEHPHADFLRGCARDALSRLILPSLEREIRRELTEQAESHAVGVFARNLRKLLLQPPVRDRRILAIDPGFTSGCKMVALDQFGNVLGHDTFYLVGKPERREEAKRKIAEMLSQYQLDTIAIGNGTASRQTEHFVAELLGTELKGRSVTYVVVNEAGASVYSTSRIGREEFPQYDAAVRGAISIGRRLLDPLSELVKIEPANLGVGLYQHDVKAKHLRESLDAVVESCVNYVGVDVNTASPALLRYVSGLNQLSAWRLYEYRVQNGPFRCRQQFREVPSIGEATFVQSAGFLKIVGGDNPLDATWIHPESYEIAGRVMAKLGIAPADLANRDASAKLAERIGTVNRQALAEELQVGRMTLDDILAQLVRPGRDPREDLPRPIFKHGILKLEDLTVGMELSGTVLNVVDFGAFVDIGLHDCGLVHVSQIADRFVRDPHELLAVGDVVKVWVLDVDKQRRRVSLTMIPPGHVRQGPHRSPPADRPASPAAEGQRSQGQPPAGRARQEQGPGGGARPGRGRRTPSPARSDGPAGQGGAGTHSRPPFVHRPPRSANAGSGSSHASGRHKPPPQPLTPLTEEMKSGKEPLRSFSDLLQFYELQHGKLSRSEDSAKTEEPQKRSERRGHGRRNKRGKSPHAGQRPPGGPPAQSPDSPPPQPTPPQVPEALERPEAPCQTEGPSPASEARRSPQEPPAPATSDPAGTTPLLPAGASSAAGGGESPAPKVASTSPASAAATPATLEAFPDNLGLAPDRLGSAPDGLGSASLTSASNPADPACAGQAGGAAVPPETEPGGSAPGHTAAVDPSASGQAAKGSSSS